MIKNIPKPEISEKFTIEDIHKIREWNYERMKEATPEEIREDNEKKYKESIEMLKKYGIEIT